MFQIFLLILLSICTILKAELPRYNIRVPPAQYHYRIPPNKQFAKKWAQPPRGVQTPIRSRPPSTIPVHMPFAHKIPMGIQAVPARPVSPPVRTFWKNTQSNIKFPLVEKPHQIPQLLKKQPFISAPSLPIPVNILYTWVNTFSKHFFLSFTGIWISYSNQQYTKWAS